MMIRLSILFLCQLMFNSRGYNEDVPMWLYLKKPRANRETVPVASLTYFALRFPNVRRDKLQFVYV